MNLIYCCAFYNRDYSQLVDKLLESYSGHVHDDTHLLIMCHDDQIQTYKNIVRSHGITKVILYTQNVTNKLQAACARLNIFNYPEIDNYDKIMYVDCDVLVMDTLNRIFDKPLDDKLYVCREQYCAGFHWDNNFPEKMPTVDLFTSAMLLFNNVSTIQQLFDTTLNHINKHVDSGLPVMPGLDQPFIVYNALLNNQHDNNMLCDEELVLNLGLNSDYKCYNNQVIVHFAGNLGDHNSKLTRIKNFYEQILKV